MTGATGVCAVPGAGSAGGTYGAADEAGTDTGGGLYDGTEVSVLVVTDVVLSTGDRLPGAAPQPASTANPSAKAPAAAEILAIIMVALLTGHRMVAAHAAVVTRSGA